ncbi:MAG: 3-isopropylmalate dehydrogenase [Candidatus Thermofonsia Clade 1 bacterium]|jgi:3-isopropylmalate dehydrogenase|uniref:3-isopropylmalate dehydrogenase n=1 Tax=Candidatus Thermofonsia Clade 1 bacterium TaxID=2364210 RepID=A0A2M8PC55_9CHLR|nr:MAG: 3-isopropylmalate dehydrogenase [Candidatus Thermofonsia Clade 1 bacterium]RMF51368.1 MAG: 3-isopropylmalate dehydrogenase [Chloroflexota bacterium]
MQATITVLSGDGIGTEVTAVAVALLQEIAALGGHTFTFQEALFGGCAIDATGDPFPAETQALCENCDAVLLGAVGGPKWSDPSAKVRPEQGLLRLRRHFNLFANLRPVRAYPMLARHAPLRADLLEGVDMLFVRELTGGAYFGARQEQGDGDTAYDTMIYTVAEVQRVARVAFRAAQARRKHLTSVDKANVLASSRLWQRTVTQVAAEFPEVQVEHALVDSFAMQLIRTPSRFDVIVTENMFGDILTDEAAVLAGSLGMLPSASLGEGTFGVYEPIHGSAPDIAGKGIANPTGTILSAAMLLRHSLNLPEEAAALEAAVQSALEVGARTADIAEPNLPTLSCADFGERVRAALRKVH